MSGLPDRVREKFEALIGDRPSCVVQAPGRVNLIGEHTDYNDGFVLPCAIDFRTVVAAAPRADGKVRAVAVDFADDTDEFDPAGDIPFDSARLWPNYVRGVVTALRQRGMTVGGADLVIAGDVPQGAGLSSSASLEVAVGVALRTMFAFALTDADLALVGQAAENEFVGTACGIMDQMIAVKGRKDHAMLLDCRSLEAQAVPVPPGTSVVIVNSNKPRALADSAYNTRREQCEAAAAFFGVTALRDVTPEVVQRGAAGLDAVAARRARHVVTENDRTLRAADALRAGDLAEMGRLMAASHASMRDDFEITVPEIDALVEIMQATVGEDGGARMTGGGFGGCVVALVPKRRVEAVVRAVETQYAARTGLRETIHVCSASDGASVLAAARF